MLRKIHGTNFFHIKFWVVLTLNVKIKQCCPQLRFFILMVRLYYSFYVPGEVAEALQILLQAVASITKMASSSDDDEDDDAPAVDY
jgi:hypothetical protein